MCFNLAIKKYLNTGKDLKRSKKTIKDLKILHLCSIGLK